MIKPPPAAAPWWTEVEIPAGRTDGPVKGEQTIIMKFITHKIKFHKTSMTRPESLPLLLEQIGINIYQQDQ